MREINFKDIKNGNVIAIKKEKKKTLFVGGVDCKCKSYLSLNYVLGYNLKMKLINALFLSNECYKISESTLYILDKKEKLEYYDKPLMLEALKK